MRYFWSPAFCTVPPMEMPSDWDDSLANAVFPPSKRSRTIDARAPFVTVLEFKTFVLVDYGIYQFLPNSRIVRLCISDIMNLADSSSSSQPSGVMRFLISAPCGHPGSGIDHPFGRRHRLREHRLDFAEALQEGQAVRGRGHHDSGGSLLALEYALLLHRVERVVEDGPGEVRLVHDPRALHLPLLCYYLHDVHEDFELRPSNHCESQLV